MAHTIRSDDYDSALWTVVDQARGSEGKLRELLAEIDPGKLRDIHESYLQAVADLAHLLEQMKPYEDVASEDGMIDAAGYFVLAGRDAYDHVCTTRSVSRSVVSESVRGGIGFVIGDVFGERME